MTNTPQSEQRSGDYSYDLAHEDVQGSPGVGVRRAHSAPVSTVTQTPEYADGDYSYDLAHDIPPQTARPR